MVETFPSDPAVSLPIITEFSAARKAIAVYSAWLWDFSLTNTINFPDNRPR